MTFKLSVDSNYMTPGLLFCFTWKDFGSVYNYFYFIRHFINYNLVSDILVNRTVTVNFTNRKKCSRI